jgi:GT2 family glycosyltransferase
MSRENGIERGEPRPGNQFNPRPYILDLASPPAWRVFDRITVATVTWNRLSLTQRFIDSVLRYSHLPYRLLIVDNGSTDGSVEYLRAIAVREPHVELIENRTNRGLLRGLQQVRDAVSDGLVVYCDNDMEVLTDYWLVLILKAFHAVSLALGGGAAALGLRVINLDEYGFRYASRRQVLEIPGHLNSEPRSSYAAAPKEELDQADRLREQVVIGWTEHLMGGAQALPAAVFRRLRLEDGYPAFIGGTDGFMSVELKRLGIPMGYVENGPVVRHNDWPYSEAKIALYEKLTKTRAVTDWSYVKWKIRSILGGK